jgi:hypothetical protein
MKAGTTQGMWHMVGSALLHVPPQMTPHVKLASEISHYLYYQKFYNVKAQAGLTLYWQSGLSLCQQ